MEVEPLDFEPIDDDTRRTVGEEMARVCRRWAVIFCQVEAAMAWRAAVPMDYVRVGIWDKPDGQPQLTGDRPSQGYEAFVLCHASGAKRWNGGGKRGVYSMSARWSGDTPHDHATQKPLALMEALIRDFTDPGDLVCDPFAGSGTTGVACKRLGRRFVGWEKDPAYHAIAVKRIAGAREQLGIFDRPPREKVRQASLDLDTGDSK